MNYVRADWPRTTVDRCAGGKREWIHVETPRYYLHQCPPVMKEGDYAGKWVIIDRDTDFVAVGPHLHKADCIKEFVRKFDPQNA